MRRWRPSCRRGVVGGVCGSDVMRMLAFEDVELDEARFELRRAGRPIEVQPKVLELIFYLARHRDRVVAKDELFASLWDGTTVAEGSLTQAVSLARKALGDSAREQRVIRTVRGRGLQFVAAPRTPVLRAPLTTHAGSTAMDTQPEVVTVTGEVAPVLFAALAADAPSVGGESWWLGDVDEVQLGRGSSRRAQREDDMARVLRITVPGSRLSRKHARLIRLPHGWLVVDEGSRNGTFVNGERVSRCELSEGDRLVCGRTTFLFGETALPSSGCGPPSPRLRSILPALRAVDHGLDRLAAENLPLFVEGESGTGKTYLAEALHRDAGRAGLHRLDLAALSESEIPVAEAEGTLVLEGIERLASGRALQLVHDLDRASGLRVITTSEVPLEALDLPQSLLSRLAGHRVRLPALRDRRCDLGALIPRIWQSCTKLTPAAVDLLFSHAWPGNLRELGHVLVAATAMAGGEPIDAVHLPSLS